MLATSSEQSLTSSAEMSLEECKRLVREESKAAQQNEIAARLNEHLEFVDQLMLKGFDDLDLQYQWINDRPQFKSRYKSGLTGTPFEDLTYRRHRRWVMPEGYWRLLEDAIVERLESQLSKELTDEHASDHQYRIEQTLEKAINEAWVLCVLGQRQAVGEKEPSAFLDIREDWSEELLMQLESLSWHGSDEMRLACVEPYTLLRTMQSPKSDRHLHISDLNKAAEARKAGIQQEIDREKRG